MTNTEPAEQPAEGPPNELAVAQESTPAPVRASTVPGLSFSDEEMMAMMKFAGKCSDANLLPDHLRGKPADCLLVLMQAKRWGMDFFGVAQCTSIQRGKLFYEGKLVHAALLASGAIDGPLEYEYAGEGDNRSCKITGTLPSGDQRSVTVVFKDVRTIGTKKGGGRYDNAWDKQPDTQLAYRGARDWARMYAPHVMLGVVAEGEELPGGSRQKDEPSGDHLTPRPVKGREVEVEVDEPKREKKTANTPPPAPEPEPEEEEPETEPETEPEEPKNPYFNGVWKTYVVPKNVKEIGGKELNALGLRGLHKLQSGVLQIMSKSPDKLDRDLILACEAAVAGEISNIISRAGISGGAFQKKACEHFEVKEMEHWSGCSLDGLFELRIVAKEMAKSARQS